MNKSYESWKSRLAATVGLEYWYGNGLYVMLLSSRTLLKNCSLSSALPNNRSYSLCAL